MRASLFVSLPLLAASALLASCAQFGGSRPSLTAGDIAALEALEPLPTNRPVRIDTEFSEAGQLIAAPAVVALSGQTAAIEIAAQTVYPTRYTLASTMPAATVENASTDSGAAFPVTPATPTDFSDAPTGLWVECTPQIIGGFVELTGSVIFRWSEGNTATAAVGEGIGTIVTNDRRVVLTENRHDLPVFGSRSSPFFVRALPGETYELVVRGEKQPITIRLTVTLLPPSRGEMAVRRQPEGALLLAAR